MGIKISALPPQTTPDGADELPSNDVSATTTKKITLTVLKEWFQSLVGWITTAMIGDTQVTSSKIDFTTFRTNFNGEITRNTTNISAIGTAQLDRIGAILYGTLAMTANASIGDSTLTLATLDLADMGISSIAAQYLTGYSDGGNSIVMISISSSGVISSVDCQPNTLSSGAVIQVSFAIPITAFA